ncbi:hypothetical protein ACTHO0_19040 [Cytobacillus praedii]|uniref:hypothetical protein n=1 Tax=Cytobacillus praedii TaxID=1742358 RepID=UPI003F7D7216
MIIIAEETNNFISVRKIDNVWWLISPKGSPFISLGINHVDPHYLLAEYNKEHTLKEYGEDFVDVENNFNINGKGANKWIEDVKKDFHAWKFNSFGQAINIPLEKISDDFYYIETIIVEPFDSYENFPDVFSETFEKKLSEKVYQVCEKNKFNKNLIGYGFIDIPAIKEEVGVIRENAIKINHKDRRSQLFASLLLKKNQKNISSPFHPCVIKFQRQQAGTSGKKQWIKLLKDKYITPQKAGEVYGLLSVSKWSDLEKQVEWQTPVDINNAKEDNELMLTKIAEKYYSLHYQYIRKYDPNHLILGDKLNGNKDHIPNYLFPIIKKYLDVILVEAFSHFSDHKELLWEIYSHTNKPIILGDSSFAAIQENQIYTKGVIVNSQNEVGNAYMDYMKDIMSVPFIVGWHICGYIEGWEGLNNPNDPQGNMQCGFKTPFNKPHEDTVKKVSLANGNASFWHSKKIN